MGRMMRQFKLQSGTTTTTCWLEDSKKLRVGVRVTLKDSDDPKRWWVVVERGENLREASKLNPQWNVGGVEVARR